MASATAVLGAVSFSQTALNNATAAGVDIRGNLAAAQGKMAELQASMSALKSQLPAGDPLLLTIAMGIAVLEVIGFLRFNDQTQSGHIATIFYNS